MEQNNRIPAPVKVLNILTIVLDVLLIILLFVKFRKQLFALLFPFFALCGDLGFEVVSMIGGTMTLDGEWMDTAVLIAECLLIFNVPLILSLAALIVNGAFLRREKRKKADI